MGKTTRLARYNLNQIPYKYAVEVTERFKGLDQLDSVPEELWTEVQNIVQEAVTKTIPKRKKSKKAKWLSEGAYKQPKKENNRMGKTSDLFKKIRDTKATLHANMDTTK